MNQVYTGWIEKRVYPRSEFILGVHIRVPMKDGKGHTVQARTSGNLSQGGIGVYTEDLGLKQNQEYDMAVVTKMNDYNNVIKVHMFKAVPRHTSKGVTGFMLIRKQKPTFA